jgi:transcriptional regulator with XRE-family HTH domain
LLRQAAGLQRRDLGARVGVSHSFIQRLELGSRVPSPETLARLARALGVSVAHLRRKLPEPRPPKRPELARLLREGRARLGHTQRGVAKRVGVTAFYLCEVEAGRRVASRARLERLAHVLGMSLPRLLRAADAWRAPALCVALKQARREAGLSMFRLAVKAGTTQSYIQEIESGRREPSPELRARLERALGA